MKALLWAILLSLLSPSVSGAVSDSRLGVHVIGQYTPGARAIVAAGPRVVKVLDLSPEMRSVLREYKSRHPDGTTVVRLFTRIKFSIQDSPEASAMKFWEEVLRSPLENLPAHERDLIDFVEGPNEGDSTPAWETVESAKWLARFWTALAPRIGAAGYRPCIGSIAVGNPSGTPEEVEEKWMAFVPALKVARSLRGAWSYHAYTISCTTDPDEEQWYALRYRRLQDILRKSAPDLAEMPLILTEGGVDESGDPEKSGWKAGSGASRFQQYLAWFDAETRKDPAVLGVTLFQIGDPSGWPSFDLEPLADWMSAYLTGPAGGNRSAKE